MYSKFYGLSHKPFELNPNPDVIFLSETHEEALAVLLYGVHNRKGFLQISGDVGTGKSTLVQALITKLEKNVHLCHIANPNFTVEEFYFYISAKFGLDEFDGNRAKFILNLAEFLKQCREKDEFALLVIDEAQVLSLELLEEIRLLSNQEYTEFGILSIFFVGQPELNALLKHKKMAPLRNRIGIRFYLAPLKLDETVAYIQFRLRKAGRTVLLFSKKAFQKIHEASGGIPRSINILCDNALLAGFAEQRGIIDENIIIDCVKELEESDVDSTPSENDKTNVEMKPVSKSPKPVLKEAGQDTKKVKPNALLIKLFFVFVITCTLFFTMMYTAEYWGRLPGTKSAKTWFEKIHVDETILDKLKELFIARKSGAESNTSEKDMIPGKVIASSGQQEEKSSAQKNPAVETKPIADPADASPPKDDTTAEIFGAKRKRDETGHESTTNQEGSAPSTTSPAETVATAEQREIRRNPGGTNYVSITNLVEGANIRSGPSMDNIILRTVAPGYPLRVIDQQEFWTLVEDFKERKGWIASKLINETNTVILKFGKVNLRSGPSYHDDIVANIDYGTVMQVEEKQGRWLKVHKKDRVVGWIHEDMVWP